MFNKKRADNSAEGQGVSIAISTSFLKAAKYKFIGTVCRQYVFRIIAVRIFAFNIYSPR
jgi:hypothetical protein